jgi:hypothetical protein
MAQVQGPAFPAAALKAREREKIAVSLSPWKMGRFRGER